MAAAHRNETNYNAHLDGLLAARLPGWRVATAQTRGLLSDSSKEPDIFMVSRTGIPIVVECKYDSSRSLIDAAERQAKKHLGRKTAKDATILEHALVVLYPSELGTSSKDTATALESATLRYALWAGSQSVPIRFPKIGWIEGGIGDMADFIELGTVSEHRINDALRDFIDGVNAGAGQLKITKTTEAQIGSVLHQEEGEQTTRMAVSIILNALVFQYSVAIHHPVPSPSELDGVGIFDQLHIQRVWKDILENINYWPIFDTSRRLLSCVPASVADAVLVAMLPIAHKMASFHPEQSQELAGQVFGHMISDRKFLASYYTLPESAALLSELTVARLEIDWSDLQQVTNLRIADFACGTGALLSAIQRSIASRVRRHGNDDKKIHRNMLEYMLTGTDILPAGVHITASTLSSMHPDVDYTSTLTYVMPYGRQSDGSVSIGSLDLLLNTSTPSLFGDGSEQILSQTEGEEAPSYAGYVDALDEWFDIVIMNPPFARAGSRPSTIGVSNIPFAGFKTSLEDQKEMAKLALKNRNKLPKPRAGNGNAGMGSHFIDLAHAKLKPGGTAAFILPGSFSQGRAWESARDLISQNYSQITVVQISAVGQEDRAFSDDTGMAEVLVVATKKKSRIKENWLQISLTRRPVSPLEGVCMSKAILNAERSEGGDIEIGDEDAGSSIMSPIGVGGGILSEELAEECSQLFAENIGRIFVPQLEDTVDLGLCRLGELGEGGIDPQDLTGTQIIGSNPRGPFDKKPIGRSRTNYPMLWGHNHEVERQLIVLPDTRGVVRAGMKEKAGRLRQTASHLHFNRDFQVNSQSLTACLTEEPSIGGNAWPSFKLHAENETEENMKWVHPVLLWANTTLGLASFWFAGTRQQLGRSRLRPQALGSLVVLDPRLLDHGQLEYAEAIFSSFKTSEFLPANEAYRDKTRLELDKEVMTQLLKIDSKILEWLDVFRDLWCREASVHGGKSTRLQ